ncbi:hypothetical protein [Alteribacter aurantiacus]|uniref:hypothetical protein n=1 Tax=Alteribacter aurantiacus TaxID=254410 RepID=UPI00040F5CB6|nr:hypothetical protein [Alteribacter aurantiacus]
MLTKNGLRGTAAGIFVTTSIFTGALYFNNSETTAESTEVLTEEDAIEFLETSEFVVSTNEGYTSLIEEKKDLEARIQDLEADEAEREEDDTHTDEMTDTKTVYQTALVVTPGMTFGEIAGILERTDIIEDRSDFNDYISNNNLEMSLKQGEFVFDSTMSIGEIIGQLTS